MPESLSRTRDARLAAFLAGCGWGSAERRLLAADASFRHYDRLTEGERRAVLMNAPPDKEKVAEFVAIARLLGSLALSAPSVMAADEEAGFVLLEDLGDQTFTRALAAGADETALYTLAVDTLVALHNRWRPELASGIPPYDESASLTEVALLVDWFLPAVSGRATPAALRQSYLDAWRQALAPVAVRRETLVLRDYHVDNLMLLPGRDGIAACGLLDFQDALIGVRAYDLVSLLEDARRDIAPDLVKTMLERYFAAFPALDRTSFLADFALLGAQRSTKIIGIFTRLDRRDGKPLYLAHISRVWRLLEADLRHPALAPVAAWFAAELPAALRKAPAAASGQGVPQ